MTNGQSHILNGPARWLNKVPLTFVICLLPFALCHAVDSVSPSDLYKQGNDAYNAGKFAEAETAYSGAIQSGLRDWVLYYNLGNAQYKNSELGKSIASYYRAFRLNSGDRDVIYNLNLAATKAGDPLVPEGALPSFFWRLFFAGSLNTLTLVVSLIFLVIAGGLGLWLAARWRPTNEWLAGAGTLLLAFGVWLGARIHVAEQPEGVIITSVGEVRSGPNTTYPANFTVPEGHRVIVLDEQEPVTGWVEIGVPDQGLKGWIPTTSIDVL